MADAAIETVIYNSAVYAEAARDTGLHTALVEINLGTYATGGSDITAAILTAAFAAAASAANQAVPPDVSAIKAIRIDSTCEDGSLLFAYKPTSGAEGNGKILAFDAIDTEEDAATNLDAAATHVKATIYYTVA